METDDKQFFNLADELEAKAKAVLPKQAWDYISGGSESMHSMQENRVSFSRLKLLPRLMRNVSKIDMRSNVLGIESSMPVWIAPMAMHGLCHVDREIATARASAAAQVPYCFSTVATSSLQEIADTKHPNTIFQLYVIRDRGVVEQWVRTAERLGFKALMITVDAPRLGRRENDERNRFTLPAHLKLKNLELLNSPTRAAQARESSEGSGLTQLFAKEVDDTLDWSFVPWLKRITHLKIIIKGLLAAEDVEIALQAGVDGIAVSNHGGRQLDYAPSALECLPMIVRAVTDNSSGKKRVPVFMDGGVRRGTDVLKALACGADVVLLGRPVMYALALGGQAGVERALALIKNELELAMALAGCSSLAQIGPALILPPQPHPHNILVPQTLSPHTLSPQPASSECSCRHCGCSGSNDRGRSISSNPCSGREDGSSCSGENSSGIGNNCSGREDGCSQEGGSCVCTGGSSSCSSKQVEQRSLEGVRLTVGSGRPCLDCRQRRQRGDFDHSIPSRQQASSKL